MVKVGFMLDLRSHLYGSSGYLSWYTPHDSGMFNFCFGL